MKKILILFMFILTGCTKEILVTCDCVCKEESNDVFWLKPTPPAPLIIYGDTIKITYQ